MRNLNREQAIAQVGLMLIERAEQTVYIPMDRASYNGQVPGSCLFEWCASADGVEVYYYATQDEVDAYGDDMCNVAWKTHHYDVA